MAQIVPGTNWAEQFGQGLGTGLNQLAQNKINQLQQRHSQLQKAQAYTGLGFSPEESHALASLPEKLQQAIVPAYLERGGTQQQEQQQEAPIQQLLQQQQAGQANQQAVQQNMPGMPKQFQVNPMENVLQSLMAQRQPQAQQQAAQQRPIQSGSTGAQVQAAPIVQQQEAIKALAPALSKSERIAQHQAAKTKPTIAEVLNRPTRKETATEQKETDKETKETYEQINKEAKVAKNNDKRLKRIEELTNKGYLGVPIFNSAINALSKGVFGFGIDLTSLMTADAQELNKLSTDFVRDAKEVFGGGRLTDADLNAFMKTLPTLSQTTSGRRRIIHNMKSFNEAAKVRKDFMDKIIEANGGRRPRNLDTLIEKAAGPQLDALAAKFEKGAPKEEKSLSNSFAGLLHYGS